MTYTYDAARRAKLTAQWTAMQVVRKGGQAEIDREAAAIVKQRPIYTAVERATGVPWWMVGVIDAREGGLTHLGTRHLHCGDPLTGYTYHEPKNRPVVGHGPPFTWFESAVDALKLKGFDKIKNWTIERALHSLEPYNGLGYYNKGIPSPYIWSFTNQYDPPFGPGGKYVADHKFDASVVDEQVGCAPLLAAIAKQAGIVLPTETGTPTPPETKTETVKKNTGVIVATGTVASGAAAQAHQSGVNTGTIIAGVVVVIAIVALIIFLTRRK